MKESIIGKRFSTLVVLKTTREGKRTYCVCLCDCGLQKVFRMEYLKKRTTTSCNCLNNYKKLPIERKYYSKYSQMSRRRGIVFNLSLDEFYILVRGNCHYCNKVPSNGEPPFYSGIDRKDNNIGYEFSNSLSCCKECNFLKGSLGYDEFLNIIKSIHDNLKLAK